MILLAASGEVLERDGLALVGAGAILLVLGLLITDVPRGLDGTRMAGARPRERWGWALSVTGAIAVAAGSVFVLIGNWPSTEFVVAITAIAIVILTAAYRWSGPGRLMNRP